MRYVLFVTILLLAFTEAAAQEDAVLRAVLFLSGAASEEELDEYWLSRLEARQGHPVRINGTQRSCDGLLSSYQLASLSDYRSRSGDIRSWEELSLVDGFSREWVSVMRPFLSLAPSSLPAPDDSARTRVHALARGTLSGVGVKARAEGSWWRAGAAWRYPKDGTFYAEAHPGRHRILLGDYNIRFGQGLTFWSGFSLSSLSTTDAFIRRATALSPAWSYSSSGLYRGVAYEYTSTRWRAMAFGALSGMAGAYAEWTGRHGQAGFTAAWQNGTGIVLSADSRWNLRGGDLAAEVGFQRGSAAALLAFRQVTGAFTLALQGRAVPSAFSGKKNGEYALAAGALFRSGYAAPMHRASVTLDAALLPIPGTEGGAGRFQLRAYAQWLWQMSQPWGLELRFTERYRSFEASRTDLRCDLKYAGGPWTGALRFEGVFCNGWGALSYLETGYTAGIKSEYRMFLRLTAFWIDRWDARIYCYERDAPGTFSVPAYYGRGFQASAVCSWKKRLGRCSLKAYLRGGWMVRAGRTPSPTLNVQLHFDY